MKPATDPVLARIDAERQQRRVDALIATLQSIAQHSDPRKPSDTVSVEDARFIGDRVDNWHAGHDAGIETGKWITGNEAQDALDEWERTQ